MKLFIYTVLCSLLFSTGIRLHICLRYVLNQRYYAEVLCENKAIKNSCCKGKCAVQKELASVDKDEAPSPARSTHSLLKLSKAEEAIAPSFIFNPQQPFIGTIATRLICTLSHGNPLVLLRPPAIA